MYFNPAHCMGLRSERYFNTLMGSCGECVMSHSLIGSGITMLGKPGYSLWVGMTLPQWSSRFTQENDGGEAV
jgi:hypothetical protein